MTITQIENNRKALHCGVVNEEKAQVLDIDSKGVCIFKMILIAKEWPASYSSSYYTSFSGGRRTTNECRGGLKSDT